MEEAYVILFIHKEDSNFCGLYGAYAREDHRDKAYEYLMKYSAHPEYIYKKSRNTYFREIPEFYE